MAKRKQPRRLAGSGHDRLSREMPCFVCSTNRPCLGKNGQTLESLMFKNHCAAMWEYPIECTKKVRILSHIQRVEPGNLVFMFAAGHILRVGIATHHCDGPLVPGNARRIRSDEWGDTEWQVRVRWLPVDLEQPCQFPGWNATFYELKGPTWADRLNDVFEHFHLDEL